MKQLKVYLAGQPNQYEKSWKEEFEKLKEFDFYDWEYHSDQSSPDTFYSDDLRAVNSADILIANPGIAPSESTWIEIGYFLASNTEKPDETCKKLIIIWKKERQPKWSLDFVKKTGKIVSSVDEAIKELQKIAQIR